MESSLKVLATILKEVGLFGFVLVFFAAFFQLNGTPEQKQEFIDKFFLLKDIEKNPYPVTLLAVFVAVGIVIMVWYFRFRIRLLREENQRIGAQKSELQSTLTKSKLQSSHKPRKP